MGPNSPRAAQLDETQPRGGTEPYPTERHDLTKQSATQQQKGQEGLKFAGKGVGKTWSMW